MQDCGAEQIRNICVMGHSGSGKTSLTEMILYMSQGIERLGKIEEGNTVSDYDPEEIKRRISIHTSIIPCDWKKVKINFLDAPGYFDFEGEVKQACRISDAALITVCAKSGVEVGTEKAWEYAKERSLPTIFFINKIDAEFANYNKVVSQLKELYGNCIAPFSLPIKEGDHFNGIVNIIQMKARKFEKGKIVSCEIPLEMQEEVQNAREMILEAVAETDENLMEKFFLGESFTQKEIEEALKKGIKEKSVVPVLCGSSLNGTGIPMLLDIIEQEVPAAMDENKNTKLFIFKTIADPYIGKLSLFRVYGKTLKIDDVFYNLKEKKEEKITHIYVLKGKKQVEVKELKSGDIGAVAKLQYTATGDTLCGEKEDFSLEEICFPTPSMEMAIMPKAKGDEEKISMGLSRLMEEDKTIKVEHDAQTHELILHGLGEQHLEVIVSKLKRKFGIEVELSKPKIAFKETIKRKVKVEGKHKKQSGGHGQYGHVWIEFEPIGVSKDIVFEEKIFGGSVPKQYIPAVEKGLKDAILHGVLAGYPVVGLKATLLDGSYHPVDSSEMAFKVAANIAYKRGLEVAQPILLEPIMKLKVIVPDMYTGDIIGDLNKRRGRILGMNPKDKMQEIEAEVPKVELYNYSADLRSMTQGRGFFQINFERYEEAPKNITDMVKEENENNAN